MVPVKMQELFTGTMASRDMGHMVMNKDGEKSGEEIIKSLDAKARGSLVKMQELFTGTMANLLQHLSTTDAINTPGGLDKNHSAKLKKELAPVKDIMKPLMSHIDS